MKLRHSAAILLASMLAATAASARDTVLHIPLADVLSMPEAKDKLDANMKFFLAGQTTPKVLQRFSTDVSNPKTNGVGKTDEFGCKWAALSALISLQNSAKRENAMRAPSSSAWRSRAPTPRSPSDSFRSLT